MATFTDTIRFVVEATTGQAQSQLKGLRSELAQAEGVGGKFRAGISGIGGALSANLTAGLAGAASAIVGFGAAAVDQFADTAREAGRLADTTGLATEEASRFLAVLRPLGVEGADLADILGNLNTKAAEGRLGELGIQAEDSNERLIETIEFLGRIQDETKRSQLAAELFGEEGTRQLAPLVAQADQLRGNLQAVSQQQVITDAERNKAADLDATMLELNNKFRDLALTIAPVVIGMLDRTANAVTFIGNAVEALPEPPGWFSTIVDKLSLAKGIWELPGEFAENANVLMGNGRPGPQVGARTGPLAPIDASSGTWSWQRTLAAQNNTVIVNPPPGYRGEDIAAAQGNFWQTNGTSTWRGQP